ncbi:MAG: hypothetical protein K6E59_00910 [Bacilli bacterium]|nr:hypothetical protein [Bacilli bacterium]
MKRKGEIVSVLASSVLGGTAYLATDAWYIGAAVGILCLVGGFFFVLPSLREFMRKGRLRHECYLFIHGYLVALSVSQSLDKAFESASSPMGKEFAALSPTLSSMQGREKVEYLASYFEADLYRMFLSILDLYLDRGGDVLRLSGELTAEASRIEETEKSYEKKAARKGISFFFLWVLSLVIIVFLRFGLQSFFASLRHSVAYLACVGVFFLFFIASSLFYVYAHTGVKPRFLIRKEKANGAS